jgi:hypothetical protein
MATPKNAKYKQLQRAPEETVTVIWISCLYDWSVLGRVTRSKQESYRIRHMHGRLRGKAMIKAAKRATHTKGFYRKQREAIANA